MLAEKVKSGAITQAQADAAAANMKTRLTTRVDSVNTACDGRGLGAAAAWAAAAEPVAAWAAAVPAP